MAFTRLILLVLASLPLAAGGVCVSNRSRGTWLLQSTYFSAPVTVHHLNPDGCGPQFATYRPPNLHRYLLGGVPRPSHPARQRRESGRFSLELAPGTAVRLEFRDLPQARQAVLFFRLVDARGTSLASPLPGPPRPATDTLEITATWSGTDLRHAVRYTGPPGLGDTDAEGLEFSFRAPAWGPNPGPRPAARPPVNAPAPLAQPASPGRHPPPRS